MFCQQVIIHPRDFNWYKVILKLFVCSGYIMETNCSCLTIKSRPFIKCPPGSLSLAPEQSPISVCGHLQPWCSTNNSRKKMIHHPQAPPQTQMAKQITIRGNIKHDLLFSALNGIFRKMKLLVWGRGRSGIGNYDQARNICVITAASGDRSV